MPLFEDRYATTYEETKVVLQWRETSWNQENDIIPRNIRFISLLQV